MFKILFRSTSTAFTKPCRGKSARAIRILLSLLLIFGLATLSLSRETKTAYADERQTLSDVFGVSRKEVVAWLESHEHDNYYLGTPYRPYDWRSPTGDINGRGTLSDGVSAGMNCTGFVWHSLCAANAWDNDIAHRLPALQGWVDLIKNENLLVYYYDSKEAMLNAGKTEKGDIIWIFDQNAGGMEVLADSHHIGIFWGDTSSDDKFWHSAANDTPGPGFNEITEIRGKASRVVYAVIKIEPEGGFVNLLKVSSNPSITENNSCYSLEGAEYDIFDTDGAWVSNLTTDSDGRARSELLSPGLYKIKEKYASVGYALDDTEYWVEVVSGQTVSVNQTFGGTVPEKPFGSPVSLLLEKIDAETDKNLPSGRASLAYAQFRINYYTGYYTDADIARTDEIKPTRSWVVRTDEQGYSYPRDSYKLSGDEFYYDESGVVIIPLGTISVREVKAPLGYLLDDQTLYVQQIKGNEELNEAVAYNAPLIKNQVIRGDLALVKVEEKTMKRLAGVPFEIKSHTTGEAHVIVTDENGYYSTSSNWAPHSQNTNRGENSTDGIWFSSNSDTQDIAVNDNLGALPYDRYSISELPCEANKNKALVSFEVVIERNMSTVDLGTVIDEFEPEQDFEKPEPSPPSKTTVMPKTGDTTGAIICVLLGIACIAGTALLILGKRNNRRDYRQLLLK